MRVGKEAAAKSITDALDELNKRVQNKQLQKGDVVAVVISSHVLELSGETLVTAADSVPVSGSAVQPAIPTRVISDLLGHLTDYGCRVILFVDGVHETDPQFKSSIKTWVRDLRQNRRVITFVASKEGPSDVNQRDQLGHLRPRGRQRPPGRGREDLHAGGVPQEAAPGGPRAQRAATGSRCLFSRRGRSPRLVRSSISRLHAFSNLRCFDSLLTVGLSRWRRR